MKRPIFILINLLAVSALTGFILFPQYKNLQNLRKDIEKTNIELKYKEEYFSGLRVVSSELDKYKEPISKIDSALPSPVSLPALYELMQKISAQSGMILQGIGSSQAISQETGIKEVAVSLSLEGSYSSLKELVGLLENSSRLFEVDSLSIEGSGEKEDGKEGGRLMQSSLIVRARGY